MSATLAGVRCTAAVLQLPAYGVSWAEVSLDEEVTLSGAVTLQIADLSWIGTVMSGGPSKGRSRYRLAAGAGQWGRVIPARQEADNAAGVKKSNVLLAAAQACGETLDASTLPAPAERVPASVRAEGPASRVLHELAPRAWYVGEDGVTRLGTRAGVPITVPYTAGPLDLANGRVEIAASSIASILPGIIVEGLTAVDVQHSINAEQGLRTVIIGAGIADTSLRLESWRRIFEALDPRRPYRGDAEFRVVSLETDRINLQPVLSSLGLPDLRRVLARNGVPGCKGDVPLGSRVGVRFMNSDPARPYVACWEDPEGDGWLAESITIDASDAVTVGESASEVVIASGNVSPLDSTGHFVRYGDPILFAVPGPGVVSAPPSSPVSPARGG